MKQDAKEELRKIFESTTEFNDLFDAFEQALAYDLNDIDLYKVLFWNKSLTPDEITFFADQLVKRFPALGYELYLWLGEMFSLTLAKDDNFEHALQYYRKAAFCNPESIEPYEHAFSCYDPVVKVPSELILVEFLKSGIPRVSEPAKLYKRLSALYKQLDNDEMTDYYNRLSGESSLS